MANWHKRIFDPKDWYWTVGGDVSRVYSSDQRKYVSLSDPAYQTWLGANQYPSDVATEDDMWTILRDRFQGGLPLVYVPSVVTMRQARLALLQAGLLSVVEPTINSLPSPIKEMAQIEWEYSSEVRRDRTLVRMLAQALSLDSHALDQLFLTAIKL